MAKHARLSFGLAALALAGFALSACNTVAGVGRDMQALGRATTHAAEQSNGHNRQRQQAQQQPQTNHPHE